MKFESLKEMASYYYSHNLWDKSRIDALKDAGKLTTKEYNAILKLK